MTRKREETGATGDGWKSRGLLARGDLVGDPGGNPGVVFGLVENAHPVAGAVDGVNLERILRTQLAHRVYRLHREHILVAYHEESRTRRAKLERGSDVAIERIHNGREVH